MTFFFTVGWLFFCVLLRRLGGGGKLRFLLLPAREREPSFGESSRL
jgi:hypothetical protein